MRPMLTLACAACSIIPGTRHHKLAAAVEFIHTATLLHDDVVDGSGLRRGKRTANIIWGNPASVLVGDFLFCRAFELMVEDGSLKVLQDPQPRLGGDRRGRGRPADRPAPDRDRRGALSRRSSAPRPRPCSPPPAGSPPVVAEPARRPRWRSTAYGRNLGIAFQLVDDAIDYASDAATMGKGVGDDFRDGKVTLPVILAYARGSEADRAFWRAAMAGERTSRRGSRPGDPRCCARPARSTTRSSARAITAGARSTRSAPSRPARPRPRWSRRSSSRSPALIDQPRLRPASPWAAAA